MYIGQKVRIKDLTTFDKKEWPSINGCMLKMSKKIDTIRAISFDGHYITLTNSNWTWLHKWLEPIKTKRSSE